MPKKDEKKLFAEFIEDIKIKYPTLEERYSILENISVRDEKGKLSIDRIKKKAFLTIILVSD